MLEISIYVYHVYISNQLNIVIFLFGGQFLGNVIKISTKFSQMKSYIRTEPLGPFIFIKVTDSIAWLVSL